MFRSFFCVNLRNLIQWMGLFFVLLALGNGLQAAYQVLYNVMLEHKLETNSAYAESLAQISDSFLISSAQALDAAALDISESGQDPLAAQNELDQLTNLTNTFNGLVVIDSDGSILARQAMEGFFAADTTMISTLTRSLLESNHTVAISGPFQGPRERWYSLIARPIISREGVRTGTIGGVIHLGNDSALHNTLSTYSYQEGSYFYIVNSEGAVIFHPDVNLIGTSLEGISNDQATLAPRAGTEKNNGEITSFASMQFANWTVIAQRSMEVILSPITDMFLRTAYYSLPIFFISLFAVWWSARRIAMPLHDLADVAANMDNHAYFSRIRLINGWYVEAALIQKGLIQSFSAMSSRMRKLHREGATDPLTGVDNRRGLDAAVDTMTKMTQDVAVVMLDIDHFKAVNDNYGHAIGDEVLKTVTTLIKNKARSEDIVARTGGEEFAILLPETSLESAKHFAERLRKTIATTHFRLVGQVTASFGVACYPTHANSIYDTINIADAALYRAKKMGRNRVQSV